MERMKQEIEMEEEGEGEEEEEEEEDEEEDEEEEEKISNHNFPPNANNLDDFELMKMKIKASLPKKIASKGIVSNLRPINEETLDEMSFTQNDFNPISAKKQKGVNPESEEFKNLNNEDKLNEFMKFMKKPEPQSNVEDSNEVQKENINENDISEKQNDEIQRRLGI